MLLWGKGEHTIRIKGKKKHQLDLSKVDFAKKLDGIASVFEAETKDNLKGEKYHTRMHVFSKDSVKKELDYVIWLGPVGTEPIVFPGRKYWWETPVVTEVADVKNI